MSATQGLVERDHTLDLCKTVRHLSQLSTQIGLFSRQYREVIGRTMLHQQRGTLVGCPESIHLLGIQFTFLLAALVSDQRFVDLRTSLQQLLLEKQ